MLVIGKHPLLPVICFFVLLLLIVFFLSPFLNMFVNSVVSYVFFSFASIQISQSINTFAPSDDVEESILHSL